jgi:hypothetical protein
MLPLGVILSIAGINYSVIEYSAWKHSILNAQRKIGILVFQFYHIYRQVKAGVKVSEPEFDRAFIDIGGKREVLGQSLEPLHNILGLLAGYAIEKTLSLI